MSVIPCKSCAPSDCFGQGSTIDPAIFYSLQGPAYRFVLNCPPGVDCANAPYLLLSCCDQIVFINLIGITGTQRTRLINGALTRCANIWQTCGQFNGGGGGGGDGGGGGGGGPPIVPVYYNQNAACCPVLCNGQYVSYCVLPGTVISPVPGGADILAGQIACRRAAQGKVQIANTRQCYTAACGGGDPFTAERCTEANLYGECLFFPTVDQSTAAQRFYDDLALGFATADANAALAAHGCLVCNEDMSGFASCPGDPTKTSHIDIAAGTFCQPSGTDPSVPFMQAQDSLMTQLHNALVGLGCACPSPVSDMTNHRATFTCATFIQYSFKSFGGIIAFGPGVYDATAVATALNGGPPPFPGNPPFRIHGIGYTAPDIVFYWG